MKEKLAIAAVATLLGVGLYYSVHNGKHPADDPALSSIAKVTPVVKSICVTPIQNLSHKKVPMDGVDDELVAQLHKVGFESRKISDGGGQCDATTNAEVVDIYGHGRKTARVDLRLTLTSEQVPPDVVVGGGQERREGWRLFGEDGERVLDQSGPQGIGRRGARGDCRGARENRRADRCGE